MPDPNLYHDVEIRPVTLYRDDTGDYYDEPTKEHPPTSWGVYGRYHGRSNCLGDFETQEQARRYADLLAVTFDWPIFQREAV
jgi:hypothetical protein